MSTTSTIGGRNWKRAKAEALTDLKEIADQAVLGSARPHTAADRMLAVAGLAVQAQGAIVRLAGIAGVEAVGLSQLREVADEAVAGVRRPQVAGERMLFVLALARAVEAAVVEMTAAAENGG